MSARAGRRRGRPPKSSYASPHLVNPRSSVIEKPKWLLSREGSDVNFTPSISRSSSPGGSVGSFTHYSAKKHISVTPFKKRGRKAGTRGNRGGKAYVPRPSLVVTRENDYHYGSDFDSASDSEPSHVEGDLDEQIESDVDIPNIEHESEDIDSEDSDFSLSNHSTSVKKSESKSVPTPLPLWLQDCDVSRLDLPPSSEDLLLPMHQVLPACAVYEVLRKFSSEVRLSPFRIEDFMAALQSEEMSSLLAEVHVMLLKAMLREEDTQQTWFGPLDQKDSTNSMLHFSDTLTWPEVLRIYLQSDPVYIPALELLESCEYPFTTCDVRLLVLKFLTDHFLCNTAVRQEILSEANIKYNDHCRVCYKVGDLLCCETCPAVFHLHCLNPPLEQVPSEDWQCPICTAQRCKGVTDCVSELEKSGLLCRQDCLGFDRHGRKYWFIARRIFVEENECEDEDIDGEEIPVDKKVWYYSSPHQFEQLLAVLDEHEYERELCKELYNLRPEILRQMSITIDLTNEFKGKNKTYLELDEQSVKENKRASPEALDNDDQKDVADDKSQVDIKTESIKEEDEEVVEESGVEVDDDFMQQLRVESEKAEDNVAADDPEKSKTGDESGTYATRSKTGSIVSRNYVDPKRRTSTPNGTTPKEGEGKLTPLPADVIYKLGMEGNYKQYVNQYSINTAALNKVQAAEERDRKRYLSHKFALTGAGEFKWIGSTFGNKTAMLHTVRATLLQLHSQILSTFMHPNWTLMRKPWIAAVNACVSPRDLGRALSVLAACIRPVVFNAVWHDSLGHIRLQRQTAFDREEKKKVDKKEKKEKELEEEMHRLHTVHYTKGLKHQIWKHKGEEFRLHGQWGWRWLSATRPCKRQDAQQSGLRAGPWKIMTLIQENGEEKFVQVEPENGEAYEIPLDDPAMEVVDICAAMVDPNRRVYSKIAKKGKLDSLLDWRLKLKVTEAKATTADSKKEEDDTEVDVEGEEEPKSRRLTSEQAAARLQALLGQSCYVSGCQKENCYSPTCRAVIVLQQRISQEKEESKRRAEAEEKMAVAINSTEAPVSLKRILSDDERNKKKRVPVKYPMMSAYMTKSKKRTIFVLPDHEIKHLSRRGGQGYVTGFHHGSKNNSTAWFYPSARPLFKTCWFFRTIGLQSLSAAALQLRILWACLRWDDMNTKPNTADGKNQLTTDSEIVTTDILKHRHVGRFLEKTQYFQRRVVIPLDVPKTVREVAPSRSGLRKRKLVEAPKFSQPVVSEEWIDEDRLDLWSIRHYHEKAERANTPIPTRLKSTPQSGIKNSGVTMEELKEKAEQQLRAQRAAHQQKKDGTPGNPSIVRLAVPVSGGKVAIPAAGGKNSIASLISSATGQGMAGRRILISKDGSPLVKTPAAGQPMLIASAGTGAAASPAGAPNKIQITRGADGKIQIRGLQPGQQLIRLGDGRFSIVSTTTQPPPVEQKTGDAAATKTIILKSATAPGAGVKPPGQVVVSGGSTSLVQQITSGKVQLGTLNGQQVLVQSANTPAATSPATPVASNISLKTETTTGTGQAATPKQALVLQSPQGPRIVVQNLQGGSLTPQQLSAIQEQLKNQLLRVVNKPGAQVVVRASTPASTTTTTSSSPTAAVNNTSTAPSVVTPSTPTSTEKSNKFVVTPDFIQQTIRKALKQENLHPDIEQKLLQLQRFQDRQKKSDGPEEDQTGGIRKRTVSNSSWQDKQDELESLPVPEAKMKPPARKIARVVEPTVKPVAVTAPPTRTPTISNEEREQKAKERSLKAQQRARERRMQQQQARLQGMMTRNSELLKKDMLRKRALLEKELRGPIQRELSALRIPSPVRAPAVVAERLPVTVKEDVAVSSPPRAAAVAPAVPPPTPAPAPPPPTPRSQKKKNAEPKVAAVEKEVVGSPPPAKKQRVSSGGGGAAAAGRGANKKKLYCICRKPYDNSKFYVGCDLCSNWFHGDCVGITEDMSQSMSEFVCEGCSQARSTQELFCLCRQPYDESQFYICCDRCQDWFHGRCVGVLQNESESIDEYTCPNCDPNVPFNYAIMRTLSTRDYEELRKLLRQLQTHKSSWPFRDPVSPRDVPDYYKIIKDPMDLRTIETKIQERRYQRLLEFIGDVTKVFDNCRYYNAKESNIARCATSLESFFVPRLKILRNSMANS